MAIADILKRGEVFVGENSTTILTGIGVAGTVTTAVLTGRASIKATRLISAEEDRIERAYLGNGEGAPKMSTKEKVRYVWPLYIPPIGVGGMTIGSIIMANRLSSKKAAALAAAYGLSERAFQEYRDKIVEKLGENKATQIRDEVAQDRVNRNPVNTREVILAGTGEVLFFDNLTGRYFQSTVENVKAAQNKVNEEVFHHMYASLTTFYEHVGLPGTAFSDDVGFNTDYICEVQFSATISSDNRPCIAIGFAVGPTENYKRLY